MQSQLLLTSAYIRAALQHFACVAGHEPVVRQLLAQEAAMGGGRLAPDGQPVSVRDAETRYRSSPLVMAGKQQVAESAEFP